MITVHHVVSAQLSGTAKAGLQGTVSHMVKVTLSGRATLSRFRQTLIADQEASNGPRRRALIESLRTAEGITLTMPAEKWQAIEAAIGT